MDFILLTLTASSLMAAAVLGWLLRQMLKREQERSAARVTALAREIDADGSGPALPGAPVAVASAGGGIIFRPTAAGAPFPVFRAALGAAIAVLVIVLVAMTSGGYNGATETPTPYAPPELLSVHHAREGDTLTVSGLVRNPAGGATLSHVSALILVFDRSGDFVASGQAALDFATFAPGDESPFRIVIPDVAEVGRYRVAFRTDEGRIEHVDRRGDVAAPPKTSGFVRSESDRTTPTS